MDGPSLLLQKASLCTCTMDSSQGHGSKNPPLSLLHHQNFPPLLDYHSLTCYFSHLKKEKKIPFLTLFFLWSPCHFSALPYNKIPCKNCPVPLCQILSSHSLLYSLQSDDPHHSIKIALSKSPIMSIWLNPTVNAQCSSYIPLDMAAPFLILKHFAHLIFRPPHSSTFLFTS